MTCWKVLFAAAAAVSDWQAGGVLLGPGPPGGFDETAVKDPSIVRHEGRWHLFYTARGQGRYTLGYVAAASLESLAAAPRIRLAQLDTAAGYAAAPQVLFFRPLGKWILIFQNTRSNYQPVWSTAPRIDRPEAWSEPVPLVAKPDKGKWIDFWLICDDRRAHLFFTRAHRDVQVMSTALSDFPGGWSPPRTVFTGVHEAVHVYRVRGLDYVMLYETAQPDGLRYFGLARAPSLDGPWTLADSDWATGARLRFASGAPRWTDQVSHGELLRTGSDERLEIDPGTFRFLIQGFPSSERVADYPSLRWSLGLIELTP